MEGIRFRVREVRLSRRSTVRKGSTDLKVDEGDGKDKLPWSFSKMTTQVVAEDSTGKRIVVTLGGLLKAHPIVDRVYQHIPFPAGQTPLSMTLKKKIVFVPEGEEASMFRRLLGVKKDPLSRASVNPPPSFVI